MPIINNTYFVGDLQVPNAIPQPSAGFNTPNNVEELNLCIEETEKNVLLMSLGYDLYKDLQSNLPITEDSEKKWKDLVNGLEYDGKIWEGLADKKSLLAYAAYCEFLEANTSYWATSGVVKSDSANAVMYTPIYKMQTAYNKFIHKYQGDCSGYPIYYHRAGFKYEDWYGKDNNIIVSLYQFLRDHSEVYDWSPEYFRHYDNTAKNTFGL